MSTAHTATPLRAIQNGNIVDANGDGFCSVYRGAAGQQAARQALVVRAFNSHDELVAACQYALTHEDGPDVRDVLRAALAAAGAT